uniref:beta-N-acetylhexosaminidase n=1 Tax=Timema tahoe TaxID=61484 RepID=A0A7R9FLY6_9NEOP|nr:unnamed protein product [Timema tahoe]
MSSNDASSHAAQIGDSGHNDLMSKKLQEINEFSSMTQSAEQIARQKSFEERIMADVHGKANRDEKFGRRLMLPNYKNNANSKENHINGDGVVREDTRLIQPKGSPLFEGQRIVHLDLKGAPPRLSYYEELFPLLRDLGTTGILMEYEDMFPFTGPQLQDIPAFNAYSKSDIKQILTLAYNNGLQVIPLIQTFGHLEYVLKLSKFADMREVPKYPQVICPSHNSTFSMLTTMIDQVVELHPGIKYLHIGCDEVYYLGDCVRCAMAMVDHKWSKTQLFLSHVVRMAKYIRQKHSGVIPLTWDDEFRDLTETELHESNVAHWVEPVVWKYTPDVAILTSEMWDKYSSVFPAVWIASAFKGATGPDKYVTDISYHLENHRSWMDIVASYSDRIHFRGIVVTGWQRYDHFSVLCELLPAGIPSLAVNLAYIQGDNKDMLSVPMVVSQILKCDVPVPMSPGMGRTRCAFPGAAILDAAERLYSVTLNVERLLSDSTVKGWLTQYNIDHSFSSPSHVEHATAELDRCRMELTYIERDMKLAMAEVYDRHTAVEWVSTFIQPLTIRLQKLWEAKERLLTKEYWPRRPLDMLNSNSQDL